MTELSTMLIEDGYKQGFEQGELKKSIEVSKIAINQGMSDELISELVGLSIREIKIIRMAIETNKTK
ncbi:hypothetical protein [Clostridium beijerinckii]|uniref:Transposase n=1 Tax=Clostridium beijerinckii TaxID=1520 RepID=A0AAW3WHF6_CLOBE|nr:hypothetical protein [Clostridium beijerinckii]MBC2460369.1 hypothetical protein [Clostridium beijerinckii]MBC2477843.1 hypothetical protein [Clostridium beijerinckii]NOV59786.1 hypothetical protein [Clostridium beijerinckii]NOV71430.1 hypothetical protein [Clostridium beijerinckii]NOW34357.1 hypothetical protein [Clostridium beijerinckii]